MVNVPLSDTVAVRVAGYTQIAPLRTALGTTEILLLDWNRHVIRLDLGREPPHGVEA